jgi:hypothetical protein
MFSTNTNTVVATAVNITSRNIVSVLLTRVLLISEKSRLDSQQYNFPRCRDRLCLTLSPVQLVLDAPIPRIKGAGRETDHSASSNASFKMRGTVPLPLYDFTTYSGIPRCCKVQRVYGSCRILTQGMDILPFYDNLK